MSLIFHFRGHLLIIGVGGSGKHSIVRLAAFAAGCDVFEITLSRGYNEMAFKDDLKVLFNNLATKPTIFLFSSAQVSEIKRFKKYSRITIFFYISCVDNIYLHFLFDNLILWFFFSTEACCLFHVKNYEFPVSKYLLLFFLFKPHRLRKKDF